MTAISCENISLSYGTDVILSGISFSLNEGDKLGIVGVNGAGKTTLINIITGETEPDSGKVYLQKNFKVGYLKQNIEYDSDQPVFDVLSKSFSFSGNDGNELEKQKGEYLSRVKGYLKNLGFSDDEMYNIPLSELSGGQKTRAATAAVLLGDFDLLIMDEPTNHLDINALEWLEDYLRSTKKTLIVISHDRFFLDKITNKILEIENTKGKIYSGNYTVYAEKKKKDREIQQRHYQNQQREIARIEAFIENQRRWNRERNIIAAESREKMLARMVKEEKPDKLPEKIKLSFVSSGRSGDDVVTVRGLSKSYGDKLLFSELDFTVNYLDRLFIVGQNGCGKSTLIKILAGKIFPDKGAVDIGYNVNMSYFDQENQQLSDNLTVMDELWNASPGMTPGAIRDILAKFMFTGDDCFKQVGNLSGGEKARLTIAKLIMAKSNLLILDEPTNHLDIGSREALEEALSVYEGTVIAVSHDRYFMDKLATRILAFGAVEKGKVFDYKGKYKEYLEYYSQYIAQNISNSVDNEQISDSKTEYLKQKNLQAEIRKSARKLEKSKEECALIEKRLSDIETEISVSETDHKKLSELFCEKEKLEERLMELYEFLSENSVEI